MTRPPVPPMRRLARHLFTLCSAVSLLLFVAVCVLWGLSTSRHNVWLVEERRESGPFWTSRRTELHLVAGEVSLLAIDEQHLPYDEKRLEGLRSYTLDMALDPNLPWSDASPKGVQQRSGTGTRPPPYGWQEARISTSAGTGSSSKGSSRFRISLLQVAVVTLLLPASWMALRLWEGFRVLPGHCRWCGYDLRATPGRCPECGTAAKHPM